MTEHPEPLVGDVLDERYRLVEQVGQGGMARVFRAVDTALGRTVAIKVLRPGVENISATERARSEVTLLASLNHPSLVMLFDAQLRDDSADYLVMEFVDGPTLTARIAQGPMDAAEAAVLAGELAEALHVVHAAGVVHRDVKPSNVLLAPPHLPTGRHRAKLADFGIALLLDSARLTTPGTIVGTAAFLAPEQVRGADPAPPADIYALGLVLLEALTGERAYPNTDGVGAALARLSTPPTVPASLGAGWVSLLERMTAMDPSDRPTALQVVEAAERLRGGRSAPALPPPPVLPAAVAAAETPVGATREYTAATAVPPAVAAGAGIAATAAGAAAAGTSAATLPLAGAGGSGVADAVSTPPSRRSRRPIALVLAAAAVVLIAAVGIWAANLAGTPGPAPTVPAVTEPTEDAPTEPAPSPSTATVDDGTDDEQEEPPAPAPDEQSEPPAPTEDERKAAEEARKEAQKAAEEARKEAQKAAEEARKQAERDAEEREKEAEKRDDD